MTTHRRDWKECDLCRAEIDVHFNLPDLRFEPREGLAVVMGPFVHERGRSARCVDLCQVCWDRMSEAIGAVLVEAVNREPTR